MEGTVHMQNILIVEDDIMLNNGICFNINADGFKTESAFTLEEAYIKLKNDKIDMIILDVNLPDGSGFDFCIKVRETSSVPILFLTACDMEIDIITGFKLGGDDYVTKPFNLGILRERILAIFRRYNIETKENTDFIIDDMVFNFEKMTILKGGNNLALTPTEFKILKVLLINRGQVLTRRVLMEELWDKDLNFVDEHALTVNINRLRAKLEEEPSSPKYIKTVYGMGYIWVGDIV
ncbi:response regulator transcription factor [Clostridium tagluense]|uniref:response regulator transcription factor n=2 Tax=Clostridium tagluense TaxID=360422 RepID=UPI001CF33708|nr:response regulator transcription factor [Clostridium tagluense]MCB2324034.1 response regulator transcription factor [Clostridium tagluense]